MRTRIFCKEPLQCNSVLYRIIEGNFQSYLYRWKIEQPGLPIAPAVLLQNVLLTGAIQAAPAAISEERP